MNIKTIDHIGINVRDIHKSLMFYREVLGFKLQKSVKLEDCTITYLLMPNGQRVELFDYYGRNKHTNIEESQVGYRHISVQVDSVDEWEAHLRSNEVPIVLAGVDLEQLGVRVILFEDPNGVVIEFCEQI